MATILGQEQPTFGKLIGNGQLFEVPPFQRDYSWDREEWEDLWLDLKDLKKDDDHYMGYVVLQQTQEAKKNLIVDGQQRISTICILILAAIQLLKEKSDNERATLLQNTYLSYKEPTSLVEKAKLRLNKNNSYIYSELLNLRIPKNNAGLKPSEKKLVEAFKYFLSELKNAFQNESSEKIASFVSQKIDNQLFFTSITVKDDNDAYKIFETLNARGVKLSTADLLKNYFFSKIAAISKDEVENLEQKWYRINDKLGNIEVTNYIRHFWNSRNYPTERKITFFKAIKNKKSEYKDVIQFINDLDENASVYAAFENPDSELWTEEQSKLIAELKILQVTQCFSLLLIAKEKLSEIEFTKVLRDVVMLSFRYNTIGGQNPNELERVYGKAATAIFEEKITTSRAVFKEYLRDAYIDDNSFENDFKNKELKRNIQLTKYILAKLEIYFEGSNIDLYDKNVTIEHILPQNPNEDWVVEFDNVNYQDYIYRIGNLTLLESSKNKLAERKSFKEKQDIFATSAYKLAQNVINKTNWNIRTIADRQTTMAKGAKTIWKINY